MLRQLQLRRPLRGRYRMHSRTWSIRKRLSTPLPTPFQGLIQAVQLALFTLEIGSYQLPTKFKRKKRRPQSRLNRLRKRGKQYAMKLRVRDRDRITAFRNRASVEDEANDCVWPLSAQRSLHYHLLMESLVALRGHIHAHSVRAAEIWRWIMRKGCNEPFAFDTCVRMAGALDPEFAGADPDTLRNALQRLLHKAFGVQLPHAEVLRQALYAAEEGDLDAVAWCLSEQDGPLSFNECCDALGFDPTEARLQIRIPATAHLAVA